MPTITSLKELERLQEKIKQEHKSKKASGQIRVVVGMGSPAIAAGARRTMQAILNYVEQNKLENVHVTQTGNSGLDSLEPVVQIARGDEPVILYGKVTPEIARIIMLEHVTNGKIVADYRI